MTRTGDCGFQIVDRRLQICDANLKTQIVNLNPAIQPHAWSLSALGFEQARPGTRFALGLFRGSSRVQICLMRLNPVVFLLLWIPCILLLRALLRHILKRSFPTWYDRRHRDAESVATGAAFLLSIAAVTAIFLVIDVIWPSN